jgi:DNA-binding MarR family transcriptional regulator
MKKQPDPSTIRAWTSLMRSSHRAKAAIEAALKAADLPPLSWYDTLLEVEKAGADGLRPFEIKDRLLMPQYGTSRLLSRIEEAGYIVRDGCNSDGRGQVVRLTDAGRAVRRKIWPVYAQCLQEIIGERLDGQQAKMLADLLDLLGPEDSDTG